MGTHFSVEDLISSGAWARALAAHLVREPASADDLAQDAWIAGATRPRPGSVSTRAWMTGILRNLARMGARSERRRRQREQEAAAAASSWADPVTPDRLLANVELHRVLAELLTTLREPLRSTVLLRYHEGRSSAEIAREQGIPEGTVRRRLKEGLSELRAMLARRYGTERWALVVAPLAAAARGAATSSKAVAASSLPLSVAAISALGVLAIGGALLTASSAQPRRSPAFAESAAAPPSGPDVNIVDVQGKETAMKLSRLGKAVQAIALAAGSASAGAPPAPAVEVRGALGKDVVERVVAEHINEVKWCYEQARAKDPNLAGRVSVQFTIADTGVVSDSKVLSSTFGNASLEACVSRCPRRWEFPKPGDGRPVVVTYPFELSTRK